MYEAQRTITYSWPVIEPLSAIETVGNGKMNRPDGVRAKVVNYYLACDNAGEDAENSTSNRKLHVYVWKLGRGFDLYIPHRPHKGRVRSCDLLAHVPRSMSDICMLAVRFRRKYIRDLLFTCGPASQQEGCYSHE